MHEHLSKSDLYSSFRGGVFFRGEPFAADSMVVACVAYVSFVKKKGKKSLSPPASTKHYRWLIFAWEIRCFSWLAGPTATAPLQSVQRFAWLRPGLSERLTVGLRRGSAALRSFLYLDIKRRNAASFQSCALQLTAPPRACIRVKER